MNRLEFNKVLKVVGINNPLTTTEGRYGTREVVHYWNNLTICFGGSYYSIVNGKMPLEVANIVDKKYPWESYGINLTMVNGGCVEIEKKEGLLAFLNEMKDYYLRENNMPETEVKKYDEQMAKVTFEVLKRVNPSISAYDWMQGDEKNRDIYNFSVGKSSSTKLGQIFRNAVLDFDNAVNPFISNDIELDEIESSLKKIRINGCSFDFADGKYRKDGCDLIISDFNTDSYTRYYRGPETFLFKLEYNLGNNQCLEVCHYFLPTDRNNFSRGEIISISCLGDNTENEVDIHLNLTTGEVETGTDKFPATSEQIAFVYDTLIKAIGYAEEITIYNMKEKANTKQLSLNND